MFLLLFGRDALVPDPQGCSFLDLSLAGGRWFEERITERLSEAVFDRVFFELVGALADVDPKRAPADPAWRDEVKQAALIP